VRAGHQPRARLHLSLPAAPPDLARGRAGVPSS
jgi:hypothetical protein